MGSACRIAASFAEVAAMPTTSPEYCADKHSDVPVELLERLPKSQKGSTGSRHRCAACAYTAGIQEGIRRARKALMSVAQEAMPVDPVTGRRVQAESDFNL
jgi:hypothetical protein